MIHTRLFSLVVSFLIHIHATYPHNPYYYTLRYHLSYSRSLSLPIPADLPRSPAESAFEGRRRALTQRGGEFLFSTDESASKPQRRSPAQSGGKFDMVIACNAIVRYHSAMLEHALYTRMAVAGATVGAAMVEVTAAAFC